VGYRIIIISCDTPVVTDSEDILVCRLVDGKLTLSTARLWPALVRVPTDPGDSDCEGRDEHTPPVTHVSREVPFRNGSD